MSFSADVKGELARLENKKQCCKLAEIAGFLRVSSSIRLAGGGLMGIVAWTENAATARHYKKLIKDYFNSNSGLSVGDSQMPGSSRHNRYYLNISPDEKSMQILRETGMMLIRGGDDYFSDGIYSPLIKTKCCRKAYLRGMFLSCGTMSDPRKGYHLEFVVDKEQTANDLKKLIGSFVDLSANITRRGEDYIVYIKRARYISDMLRIMGADDAVMEFENIRISKSLHGDVQRLINCDNANVDRAVSAAEEQRGWIRQIAEAELGRPGTPEEIADTGSAFWTAGLRHLPPHLKEAAFLRLYKPDASLTDIGETLVPPIGKAAVSKRFAKLRSIAENGKESDN